MKRKIAFLFCVIIIVFCKENYAKYIVEQTILIAEINIDTIFPEIELISITETPEKEQYKVNFQIKVVENNIKINKFNKENIVARIGEKKIENEEYELNKVYEGEEFIYVLEGILTVYLDGSEYCLNPGDSIQIHSQTPHDWVNNTNRVVKILTVHTPNPFVHGNEVVF